MNMGDICFMKPNLYLSKAWVVLKQSASSGVKVENFEFENEKWYKELKKEIKPPKSMFTPPEPK